MFNNKLKAILVSVIFLAALAIGTGTAWAIPQIPESYTGTVYVGGVKAGAGLVVTASMTGWTSATGDVTDNSGVYELCVLCDPPSETSGMINFYVNGVQADETHIFTPGGGAAAYTYLDLHVDYIPPPTPTLTSTPASSATTTPTATPAPTPTPEPISSNGAGNIGASGGTVATTDGTITITFPPGAFADNTSVSIQGGACAHGATADFIVGGTCFNVTPDGALGANATVCVNLSVYDFSIVDSHSDLTLGYWLNGNWIEAENITLNGIALCGQITHLSDWAVLGAAPAATPTATASATPEGTATPTPTATQTPSGMDKGGTNWVIVGCIFLGVLLLIAVIIFAARGRGKKKNKKPGRKPQRQPVDKDKDEYW